MPQERPLQNIFDTVRIPVVGEDTASGHSFRLRSRVTNFPGQTFLNCFPIKHYNSSTGAHEVWLESREGLKCEGGVDLSTLVNSPYDLIPVAAINFTTLNDVMVVAFWDCSNNFVYIIQYRIAAETALQIGSINMTSYENDAEQFPGIFLSELMVAGVPTLAVAVNENPYATTAQTGAAYYATSSGGVFTSASLTQIVDGDFPTNLGTPDRIVGGFVQMNGTTYIMGRSGAIYNSDLNSISSWNALGVKQATSYPDRGLGLLRYKHHIMAFGEDTIEFFNDIGTAAPASPLARTDQAFIKLGAYSSYSFVNIEDTVFWVSGGTQGNHHLYRLEGYTPVKLSHPPSSQQLTDASHPKLYGFNMNGCQHVTTSIRKFVPGVFNTKMDPSDDHPFIETPEGVLCYNTQSNEWWYFMLDQDSMAPQTAFFGFIPVTQLGSADSRRVFWVQFDGPGSASGQGSSYNQNPCYLLGSDIADQTFDTLIAGHTGLGANQFNYKYKIPFFFTLNWLDFGTEKRKRIHKIKLIMTQYNMQGADSLGASFNNWDADNNLLYFIYTRSDAIWRADGLLYSEAEQIVRSVDLMTTTNPARRYYITNCGTGRYWNIGFASKIWLPIRVRAIEVDISQGF